MAESPLARRATGGFKRAMTDSDHEMRVLGSEMELVASQLGKNNKSASALMAEVRYWRRKLIISGRRWRRRVPHLTMLLLCLVRVIHGRRAAASKPKPRWCPECISQLDVPAQRPQPPGFKFDTSRFRHGQQVGQRNRFQAQRLVENHPDLGLARTPVPPSQDVESRFGTSRESSNQQLLHINLPRGSQSNDIAVAPHPPGQSACRADIHPTCRLKACPFPRS